MTVAGGLGMARISRTSDFDASGCGAVAIARAVAQFGSEPAYFYEVERVYNPLFRIVLSAYHLLTHKKR